MGECAEILLPVVFSQSGIENEIDKKANGITNGVSPGWFEEQLDDDLKWSFALER